MTEALHTAEADLSQATAERQAAAQTLAEKEAALAEAQAISQQQQSKLTQTRDALREAQQTVDDLRAALAAEQARPDLSADLAATRVALAAAEAAQQTALEARDEAARQARQAAELARQAVAQRDDLATRLAAAEAGVQELSAALRALQGQVDRPAPNVMIVEQPVAEDPAGLGLVAPPAPTPGTPNPSLDILLQDVLE